MTTIAPDATVGQIVAQHPALARTFESLQIDYCCGGKRPLEDVCRERGIPVSELVDQLVAASATATGSDQPDWTEEPLAALCDHIMSTHHDYLRRELPRLSEIIARVVRRRARHPELEQVASTFHELRAELEPHMMKEDLMLFPAIRSLEANQRPTKFPFGRLENPIRVMLSEHDHSGDALARIRELTADFAIPEGACNTYRVMLESLEAIERDMHQHVHKENNILFPRAVELESRVATPVQ